MSFLSAMQFGGAFLSPGLGALAALIPLPVGQAAGLFAVGLSFINIILLVVALGPKTEVPSEKPSKAEQYGEGEGDESEYGRAVPGVKGWCMRWGPPAFFHWVSRDIAYLGVVLFIVLNTVTRAEVRVSPSGGLLGRWESSDGGLGCQRITGFADGDWGEGQW